MDYISARPLPAWCVTSWSRVIYPTLSLAEVYDQLIGEVRALMGALAFVHVGLHKSPYAGLTSVSLWVEICDLFLRDACALLGVSVDSPLLVV